MHAYTSRIVSCWLKIGFPWNKRSNSATVAGWKSVAAFRDISLDSWRLVTPASGVPGVDESRIRVVGIASAESREIGCPVAPEVSFDFKSRVQTSEGLK